MSIFDDLNKIWAELDQLEDAWYGKHWRTSASSKGSPADQPNSGPGGSKEIDSYQRAIDSFLASQNARQRASIVMGPGGSIMGFLGDFDMPNTRKKTPSGKWCPPWMSGELGKPNAATSWLPHTVPLKSEGVQAGEIVAWRAWYWLPRHKRLRSLFVDYTWPTDNPATGEPWNGYGIHAFKHPDQVWNEYIGCHEDLVMGQVMLWGDVVEYEGGFTAEFAKIASVHTVPKCTTKEEVKKLYGVK